MSAPSSALRKAIKAALQAGDELGYNRNYSRGLIKFGQEGMTPEAKLARANAMGVDTNVFHHGTPDARSLKAPGGGFEKRSQDVSYISDPDRYADIQAAMAAERAASGVSPKYMSLLDEAGALNVRAEAPRPVYMVDSKPIARTYARDDRAWDYQNAEPDVLPLVTRGKMLELDGRGARFANLPIETIRSRIPADRLDEFDELIRRYSRDLTGNGGNMSTNDLEAIAHQMGFDGFTLSKVVDDYMGKGKPATVKAVFDPSHIRHQDATFDPARKHRRDLMAALALSLGGAGAGFAQRDEQA